jgi:hypothetical protein
MTLRLLFLAVALLAAVLSAAGCGQATVAPVSGKVTLDGQPLAGVHVSFQPIGSRTRQDPGGGSYAISDSSGGYTLRLVEGDRPGAVVGKHRVEITARNEADDDRDRRGKAPRLRVVVPEKFNRFSELTIEVKPGGTATANFDLKSQ